MFNGLWRSTCLNHSCVCDIYFKLNVINFVNILNFKIENETKTKQDKKKQDKICQKTFLFRACLKFAKEYTMSTNLI